MADIEEGHHYQITNAKAGTVLDLNGMDNYTIVGYTNKNGDNQKWEMQRSENGWYLKNVGTGAYLGFEGDPHEGTRLTAWADPCEWQIWKDEQDSSAYRLFIPNTTLNIDLSDHGNSKPGTPIGLWGKWEGRHQCWHFSEA
ncbi:carbohydrate-binding module family 13 protein [Schizophyllum amplum]|uniref:Carbohydrate-binding module family 13 protein n=1 Tax=Schizophyllum amplum TaxID=97359 RepID=A0A550CPR8_9AGAR|nr:carbohydrate-binding module family 13 protein [Auriculariopsis ampla]